MMPAPPPQNATRPGSAQLPPWLALAAVLALATGLRVWEAVRTPLWFDEIFTLMVARLDVSGLLAALANDMHPPLHYLLEHLWIRFGGEGELWLKSLSILIGVATVAALYGLVAEAFGRGAGLFAALLLAVHRTHVYYSQEARSYALLWLWYVLAAWMAWRWTERGRPRDAALFVLTAAAALYTHYQAGLVLAGLGVWGAAALARTPRKLGGWLALNAAVVLLFLPQLGTFLSQWHRLSAEYWVSPVSPAMFLDVLRIYSFGVVLAVPLMAGLALLPLVLPGHRRAAALVWMASLVPMMLAYVLAARGAHVYTDRYMMFVLPGWCALASAGLAALGARWVWLRRGLGAALLLVAVRTLATHLPNIEAVELARAEQWLRPRVQAGDVVAFADGHAWFFFRHHAPSLGRQILVLPTPHMPYYEGALFVPDSARVTVAAWDSLTVGRRWFGVRARHGGIDSRPAFERMVRGARAIEGFGPVTVTMGQ